MPEVVFAIPGKLETPTGGYGYDRALLARLPDHGVAIRHLELPATFPFPFETDVAATFERLGGVAENATLLVDGLALGALPADGVRALRSHVVALVHHPLGLEAGLSPGLAARLIENEREVLSAVRHVVVTSAQTAAILETDFAVPAARITVAEPGTERAPRAIGSAGAPALLAVGAVSERKGFVHLVEALRLLADLPWTLTIAGSLDRASASVAALSATIDAAGLSDRIRLVGSLDYDALGEAYGATDVFVMPSLYEGYGMVLAEALARGLPVVTTSGVPAAAGLPPEAARTVPPGDPAAFAAALRPLIADAGLRRAAADAAWACGQSLPSWDETARIVAGCLSRVAAHRHAA